MVLDKQKNSAPTSRARAFFESLSFTPPPAKRQVLFWSFIAVGLTLDLWTKSAVFAWMRQQPGDSVSIIAGFLRIVAIQNPGAAFGIAAGQSHWLALVSAVALVVILMVFFFSRNQPKLVHVALALFTAGVCGNLYDRIFNHGMVRDFIDVVYYPGRHWPAFNLADAMLCVAVALIIISSLFTEKSSPEHVQQHK